METVNLYSGRITPEQEEYEREIELQDTRQRVQESNDRLENDEC